MEYLYQTTSAIGHFKKQFAYLEENIGKSGSVIPPERKHVSLPRSTVNSCTIPPKTSGNSSAFVNCQVTGETSAATISGGILKVSRPPPRVPNAKPERLAGPVLPYENARYASENHDGRMYVQNAVLHQSISPHCFHRTNAGKNPEKYRIESEMETSQVKQRSMPIMLVKSINGLRLESDPRAQPQYMPSKLNSCVSFGINSNPYYQSQVKAGMLNRRIAIDAKLLQAQTQLIAGGAAAAARRDVRAVQLGLT